MSPSLFEEDLDPKFFKNFWAYVEETALQKVFEVENRLNAEDTTPYIIIGADTMVALNGKMFGKPKSKEEAFHMLSRWIS